MRDRRRTDAADDLDRGVDRIASPPARRLRAHPLAAPARALRVAVAAHRPRLARALALARWPEHHRRLVRRADVSTCGVVRRCAALRPRRAAALLDGHLAPR